MTETKEATKPAAKSETGTKDGKTQTIKAGDTTIKVVVEEEDKSSEQLEKEAHEAIQKQQEVQNEAEIDALEVKVEEAKTALKQAEDDLQNAKDAQAGKPSSKGGASTLLEGEDLKKHQLEHGQAPLQPGEYEPVEPEDAKVAKTNRGRGLGG